MPTETFFHLPKEKQKRILEAARKEFSRVPLNEASIANIIKDAEIPRGSFYQYFENKEDLYFHYFHTLQKNSQRDLIRAVEHENGDLFAGFEWYFSKIIEEVLQGRHAKFYRLLFMNMDYRSFHRVSPHIEKNSQRCPDKQKQQKQQELIKAVDKRLLKVEDDRELRMLIHMLMHTVFSTIIEAYRQEDTASEVSVAIGDFNSKVSWLRDGAKRKEEITWES